MHECKDNYGDVERDICHEDVNGTGTVSQQLRGMLSRQRKRQRITAWGQKWVRRWKTKRGEKASAGTDEREESEERVTCPDMINTWRLLIARTPFGHRPRLRVNPATLARVNGETVRWYSGSTEAKRTLAVDNASKEAMLKWKRNKRVTDKIPPRMCTEGRDVFYKSAECRVAFANKCKTETANARIRTTSMSSSHRRRVLFIDFDIR
uniref:Lipocalin n=1 Tax=Panagrellus redivivus TaxID=6233 RepID=A0A7E4VXD1_PANRE